MHNVLVLGVPRSGTSLTASLFGESGYYSGDRPVQATDSNPKGYFEDHDINALNNRIIRESNPLLKRLPLRSVLKVLRLVGLDSRSLDMRSWAHRTPPRGVRESVSPGAAEQIRVFTSREPFCYKDPRFTYTFDAWRPLLPDATRMLVVFRSPEDTVTSMLKNAQKIYTPPLPIDAAFCDRVYRENYEYLLDRFSDDPRFMFVAYESVLSGEAIGRLEEFCDCGLSHSAGDPSLARSRQVSAGQAVSGESVRVFDRLRSAAEASLVQPAP